MSDLMRCPFCGGEGHLYDCSTLGNLAICLACDNVSTTFFSTEAEAEVAWNIRSRRAAAEALLADPEALETLAQIVMNFAPGMSPKDATDAVRTGLGVVRTAPPSGQ